MTNLDKVLKSRDVTLPTKVHVVKAMAFPVVVYGYKGWTRIPWTEEPDKLQSMGRKELNMTEQLSLS